MFDERAFISQVEAAGPEELADILMRPSLREEKALRAYFGDARYRRMHNLALKRKITRSVTREPKGNVIVIHGIMGGELKVSSGGPGDLTWVNAFRIFRGWLDRLRLTPDGRSEVNKKFTVIASNIMQRYYGELQLKLSENWTVKPFWFDWRKDIDLAADELNTKIRSWFGPKEPVHIVAHSMGGMVTRTFIKLYRDRWNTMWDPGDDKRSPGTMGGRLVMLGTPNQGSFAIPQVITGLEGLVKMLALVDVRHSKRDLLDIFNSFVGSFQMLPSPLAMKELEPLYNAETYARFNVSVSPQHLANARKHHQWLRDEIDPKRMIYIAGYDQTTFAGIADWTKLDKTQGYRLTRDGDGRVTHALGLLPGVPTYYVKDNHGNLSSNSKILGVLSELLATGKTDALATQLPAGRAVKEDQEKLRQEYEAAHAADAARLQISLRRMNARGMRVDSADDLRAVRETDANATEDVRVSPEERKVEETITRGFLAYRGDEEALDEDFVPDSGGDETTECEIGVIYGGIENLDYEKIRSRAGDPIDAIAVGHYIGVQPQYAELELDRAISAALAGKKYPAGNAPRKSSGKKRSDYVPRKSDLLLTQYTERGIIHGRLGQPFILPDPRAHQTRSNKRTGRLIAIAGMNEPGRFGEPELTVLARELCWSLGRLKKLHLATVVIGSGEGNLALRDAVSGWLSGIRRALGSSEFDTGRRLKRVTFVDSDPRRVITLDRLIASERDRHDRDQTGFRILYQNLNKKQVAALKKKAYEQAKADLERRWETQEQPETTPEIPARVTLSLDPDKKVYRFGAITDTASVPEREIVVDPKLIWQANNELAGEQRPSMQLERGRFLEELLMPDDLSKQLTTKAPLVMMLDATSARIHWEMVAQPTLGSQVEINGPAFTEGEFEYENNFLGTIRGFTRQLRTSLAPPPEPPPPPQKIVRVLVVADPAPDGHLPGAQEEGVMVADLFESYNLLNRSADAGAHIEVKRLLGPVEATRTNVLRELMVRQYDVLHFAGHCVYEWNGDPNLSGWIFNVKDKEILSANELRRIDRIPKFVFSNACESGVTPDRSEERNDKLAPSFAEAFFERGVANFVCTAWPVDDVAARTFALTLYAGLLGIALEPQPDEPVSDETGAQPMYQAMKKARLAIARTQNGRTTWGAYQHYGNPYFRLFYAGSPEDHPKVESGPRKRTGASKKKRTRKAARKPTRKTSTKRS